MLIRPSAGYAKHEEHACHMELCEMGPKSLVVLCSIKTADF